MLLQICRLRHLNHARSRTRKSLTMSALSSPFLFFSSHFLSLFSFSSTRLRSLRRVVFLVPS